MWQEKAHRKPVSELGKDYPAVFGLVQGFAERTCFPEQVGSFPDEFQPCPSRTRSCWLAQGGFGYQPLGWGPECLDRVHSTGYKNLAGLLAQGSHTERGRGPQGLSPAAKETWNQKDPGVLESEENSELQFS